MDALLSLKPILTALILPAAALPLLVFCLSLWGLRAAHPTTHQAPRVNRAPRWALSASAVLSLALWLLSCPAVTQWLAQHVLPQVVAITPPDLQRQQVQAIVVLGGGAENDNPEYGGPHLTSASLERLLYGVYLGQATHLPVAFSGGKGWGAQDAQAPEAEVANTELQRLGLPRLRWQENLSRDTHENAQRTAELLAQDGITRIALVTHAWHMPRSLRQFEKTQLNVVAAPMGFIHTEARPVLQWIANGQALTESGWLLKEWLGLRLT